MKNCPTCHHLNERAAETCELCGAPVASSEEQPIAEIEPAPQEVSPPTETAPSGGTDPTGLTAALMNALEVEKEEGRARGEGPQSRRYMLRPLPMPTETPSPSLGGRPPSAAVSAPPPNTEVKQPALPLESETESQAGPAAPQPDAAAPSQTSSEMPDASDAQEQPSDTLVCPYCQTGNPPANRFCGGCGARMPAQAGIGDSRPLSSPQVASIPTKPKVYLVCINEDGTDGSVIPMSLSQKVIGRSTDPRFASDAFLSPQHARLALDVDGLFIEDLKSLNGTFLRIRDTVPLRDGACFLMGRQVLRLERLGYQIDAKSRSADGTRHMGSPMPTGKHRLVQVGIGGVTQNVYCIGASGAVLGREQGEITFLNDKFMSAKHARISVDNAGSVTLSDLNSSNGTWLRLVGRHRLDDDDFVFLGQQLFRVRIDS